MKTLDKTSNNNENKNKTDSAPEGQKQDQAGQEGQQYGEPSVNNINITNTPNTDKDRKDTTKDNMEVLNRLLFTDDSLFKALVIKRDEISQATIKEFDKLSQITINAEAPIRNIKDKAKKDFEDIEKDLINDTQKKAKELKFNRSIFEDGSEAKKGISGILSLLITNMDKKGNISLPQYRSIKAQLQKFVKNKKRSILLDKNQKDAFKYDETKAFYRKINALLKQSITGDNMNDGDIKERVNKVKASAIKQMNDMGAIKSWIRAVVDFFRKISSVYKDLYEATADFSEGADKLTGLCNDFCNAKTQEEKDEIAQQIVVVYGSLKNTIMSLELSKEDKASFEEIEQMIDKLNNKNVNVADWATNIMRTIGAQATNKAFEISRNLNGDSDITEKREFFTKKIYDSIKIKNKSKAGSLAVGYIGNGVDALDVEQLSKDVGMEKKDVEEIMNGAGFSEIDSMDKKYNSEVKHSKIQLEAQDYITNTADVADKKVKAYKKMIEDFSRTYQTQLNKYFLLLREQKKIYADLGVTFTFNDAEIKAEITNKANMLNALLAKIKEDLGYKDEQEARETKINDEQNKIDKIKEKINDWIKEDQNKDGTDKDDKAEELAKLRGFLKDLDNACETKFDGYTAIENQIEALTKEMQEKQKMLTAVALENLPNKYDSLMDLYTKVKNTEIKQKTQQMKQYIDLHKASNQRSPNRRDA